MEVLLRNLKIAIFNVMETMFFLLPDEDSGEMPDIQNSHSVYIGIRGEPSYLISLTYDHNLAVTMATDLLGVDAENATTDTIQNCLSETANIITGNFLLTLGENGGNITFPQIMKQDVFGKTYLLESGTITLSFNGFGVSAMLEKVTIA
jgi:CheY-specific phosphatase CheX